MKNSLSVKLNVNKKEKIYLINKEHNETLKALKVCCSCGFLRTYAIAGATGFDKLKENNFHINIHFPDFFPEKIVDAFKSKIEYMNIKKINGVDHGFVKLKEPLNKEELDLLSQQYK